MAGRLEFSPLCGENLVGSRSSEFPHKRAPRHKGAVLSFGENDGTRTHDLQGHNLALPPTELHPPCRGVPWGIRTLDLLLRRQLLYPTELKVHFRETTIIIANRYSFVKWFCKIKTGKNPPGKERSFGRLPGGQISRQIRRTPSTATTETSVPSSIMPS